MLTTQNPQRTHWLVCIGLVVLFLIPYSVVGHLPLHREIIGFLPGEANIPFLPWTFFIYLSVFLQAAVAIRYVPRKFLVSSMYFAFALLFTALAFFLAWPLAYPRELYPTTNAGIAFFRLLDLTGNSFPSLHVAMSFFLTGCYSFFEESRTRRTFFWVWSVLITASVLTTKQHYIIDIIGGVLLAAVYLFFARRKFASMLS